MVQSSGSTMYEKPRDSEQTLPRYSVDGLESGAPLISGEQETQRPQLTLPEENDTSDAVRTFLRDVLTTCKYADEKEAEQIAAKWKMGKGKELRAESPHLFRSILGDEAGWILYKEVQVQKHLEQEAKKPSMAQSTKVAIAALVDIAIFLALLYPTFTFSSALVGLVFILWFFGIIIMLVPIAIVAGTKSDVKTAENNAEGALRTSYRSYCTGH